MLDFLAKKTSHCYLFAFRVIALASTNYFDELGLTPFQTSNLIISIKNYTLWVLFYFVAVKSL